MCICSMCGGVACVTLLGIVGFFPNFVKLAWRKVRDIYTKWLAFYVK